MIPTSSLYPEGLDSDTNLFLVHDSLRAKLIEDYNPGNTSIKVFADFLIASRIPTTGLITLTEQCSEVDKRAISFFYDGWDSTTGTFSNLELLPTFEDVIKPKNITNVTVNVMAMHHNHLKNALIALQEFCGVKGREDLQPFGPTLEGRINFLRRVVLQPKAWFTANKRTGNIPLEVEFKNMSFRLGTDGTEDEVKVTWDFGDQTTSVISSISLINATSMVPDGSVNVLVRDTDSGTIKKIYHEPGIYNVKLTVENNFGKDICLFEDFINARVKAPEQAVIVFNEDSSSQLVTPGVPPNGPFETVPRIRSPINTLIDLSVPLQENILGTPGYTFAGELLNENDEPVDPVKDYTWSLGDDLAHPNSYETKASYSIGGVYDIKLRVDTEFGAYRITNYENAIDIVEKNNLWLWTIVAPSVLTTSFTARAYEFGLISETFKLINAPSYTFNRDESFLDSWPAATQEQAKSEFRRNASFTPRGTTSSGMGGSGILYWASGRSSSDAVSSEKIKSIEFDGFRGTYVSKPDIIRPWNWVNVNSPNKSFFIFGAKSDYPVGTSPTNISKQTVDLVDMSVTSQDLISSNYLNGAQELTQNVSIFEDGLSVYGDFSIYRTAWKDNTGFILRNDAVGTFFRLKSFYKTEGILGNPFINIRKLQDIQGPTKLNGQLASLSTGVFFLNNSGSVSKYDPIGNLWTTGGPGVNSALYRSIQDTSVIGYDQPENSLLVASDGDKRAYLSFDYSSNSFLKFSEIDTTFQSLGSRPSGDQWIMGVF
jgi:PKD repeat protein